MLLNRCCSTMLAIVWSHLALLTAAQAQTVSGTAKAIDGDSLVVGTQKVRLLGIDAPELSQTCTKDGSAWQCGEAAKENLAALVTGQTVYCAGQGVDQHARLLAVCSAGGVELNEAMVSYGWALAYREFSDAYVPAELRAKTSGLGIWSSKFMAPSDYRLSQLPSPVPVPTQRARAQPRAASNASQTGCMIKGNRNRRGEWIYHLPGMPYYEQTRPEEIFCTEAEAMAAGYRRAKVRY